MTIAELHPHPRAQPKVPPSAHRRRLSWRGWALIGSGTALLPWIVLLQRQMPTTATVTNWSLAWVGLDALEAALLITGGLLHRAGSPTQALPLAAASAVLLLDGWLDVVTSAGRDQAYAAALLALEVPLALLCLNTAARSIDACAGTKD